MKDQYKIGDVVWIPPRVEFAARNGFLGVIEHVNEEEKYVSVYINKTQVAAYDFDEIEPFRLPSHVG